MDRQGNEEPKIISSLVEEEERKQRERLQEFRELNGVTEEKVEEKKEETKNTTAQYSDGFKKKAPDAEVVYLKFDDSEAAVPKEEKKEEVKTEKQKPAEEKKEPVIDYEAELVKNLKGFGFVDVTHIAESEARDVAEARLTEARAATKGWKPKAIWDRVWKHNIAREYYRQKEIVKVRGEIYTEKNIYKGSEVDRKYHQEAMSAVAERFVSEFSEVVHTESGEKKGTLEGVPEGEKLALKQDIAELVKEYASGKYDNNIDAFEEERNRILGTVAKYGKNSISEGKMYADNLRTVGEQVRNALKHGVALERVDTVLAETLKNFDITVGSARAGVQTEANYNSIDKLIQKVNSSKIGSLLGNETTIAAGIAIATSLITAGTKGAARSTGRLAGFLGGIAVSGGLAALKENMRMKQERAQHIRERAKGFTPEKGSPRRGQMERTTYKMASAVDLRNDIMYGTYLNGDPAQGLRKFSQADFDKTLGKIAEIEGRIAIANKEKIDLIAYSNLRTVEKERSGLEIELAKAKVFLKKEIEKNPDLQKLLKDESFDDALKHRTATYQNKELKSDIEQKNKLFAKMKRKAVARAAVKGMVNSVVIGTVVHEVAAFVPGTNTEGVVERMVRGRTSAEHLTALERLREGIVGGSGAVASVENIPNEPLVEMDWKHPGEHIKFPEGTELNENADGTVTIIAPGGKIVADHIKFEFDHEGNLSPETEATLDEKGILLKDFEKIQTTTPDVVTVSPGEYLEGREGVHTIKREMWYDNNTEAFDKGELDLHWGGDNEDGIDAQGNYVFNVARMEPDGSFHNGISVNAQEMIKEGKLKMLLSLSKGTQNLVFEVPIDANGNAIIDPNSEIGKLFFTEQDGKAVFIGKYAEVAHSVPSTDGVEHVRVLATDVGPGLDAITETIPGTSEEIEYEFIYKDGEGKAPGAIRDWDVPPTIPFLGRRPLEPMKEGAIKEFAKPKSAQEQKKESKEEDTGAATTGEQKTETQGEEKKSPEKGYGNFERGATIPMTKEEYDALREDLELINKKIQGSEGIITINEKDFKSAYAKSRYFDLEHIKEGKPVTFNKSELPTIGDEIERILTKGRILKTAQEARDSYLKMGISKNEEAFLRSDIEKINAWSRAGRHIFTVDQSELGSSYGKLRLMELIKQIKEKPALYQGELITLGDEIDNFLTRAKKQ
jgi:hypothetical protein